MILAEMERLYQIGFATHWIQKNSKAPVKARWSEPTRDSLKTLRAEYRKGYGLGVKLGQASKLSDGLYLANIDIDIKSKSKVHREEAIDKIDAIFPNIFDSSPLVKTGNGYRVFVKTREPMASFTIARSSEVCRVHLPGTKITGGQRRAVERGLLTEDDLAGGWRIRPCWELEFMSIGKQGLVPPSTHPETGRPYSWVRGVDRSDDIPEVEARGLDLRSRERNRDLERVSEFIPVKYDLDKLTVEQIAAIRDCEGVDDRSAACFSLTLAMLRAGYSDEEILTILTDRKNLLAETAYEHRNTKNRGNAAKWVSRYCIRKAKDELSAAKHFEVEPGETPILDDDEAVKRQSKKLASYANVSSQLDRSKTGSILSSYSNAKLVLESFAGDVIGRDEFAIYDRYIKPAPWGWKPGRVAGDKDDLVAIKKWVMNKFGFAPSLQVLDEIVTMISLENAYHPIRRELENLPDWDGKRRLDYWLTKFFEAVKDPQHYVGDVFRKWLVASIMRVYQPGFKMDWMPVLEGPTGIGKCEFAKILAGNGYHIDNLPNLEKTTDAALALEGARIVEFEELSALRGATSETIKGFISRQRDKVRRPYDKKPVYIERQCVFLGTTNHETYLFDETGNRRYMPIRVGQLNIKQLKRDRDQLWAEAFWIYQNFGGELLYLEGKSFEYSKRMQTEKMVATESGTMNEAILDFMNSDRSNEFNFEAFGILKLFESFGPLASWKNDSKNVQAATVALKQLGASKRILKGYRIWSLPVKK